MGSPRTVNPALLEVRHLVTTYTRRRGLLGRQRVDITAVADVDLTIGEGQTLGLVGESGCGKTSVARSIVGLTRPESGEILLDGRDLLRMDPAELRRSRKSVQMVFQDPYSSLNPHMTVRELVSEGWEIHKELIKPQDRATELQRLLDVVGIDPSQADRYPHHFSGGQRQRIGLARALAVRPRLLVCDEPVSALDVSIQAQVINLFVDLQRDLGLSYLFISHDLSIVRHVAENIAVMYLGRIVETGPIASVYERPTHPYTVALLSATLPRRPRRTSDSGRIVLHGDVPSPSDPPSGCRFRTRCWLAQAICAEVEPALVDRGTGHPTACHFPLNTTPAA
jgi:oligopeptide transport system ATP-binding protein